MRWWPSKALALALTATQALAAGPVTLDDIVRSTREDAARRSGMAADALVLVSAEAVTWQDGSIGCPQPDRMYTEALVPGYRVRLKARTRLFDYHVNGRGHWVLCPASRSIEPLPARGN